MAHKKGAGSTLNNRDSISKRLGIKIYGNQIAKIGSIIMRQRGLIVDAGVNTAIGKDFTLFALKKGLVKYKSIGMKKIVNIL
tara:strand:+ start:142 stop:387 length:246 start_codon:yes stop_codon:yes gene_type:complete